MGMAQHPPERPPRLEVVTAGPGQAERLQGCTVATVGLGAQILKVWGKWAQFGECTCTQNLTRGIFAVTMYHRHYRRQVVLSPRRLVVAH